MVFLQTIKADVSFSLKPCLVCHQASDYRQDFFLGMQNAFALATASNHGGFGYRDNFGR
jgi:hypothetical protein